LLLLRLRLRRWCRGAGRRAAAALHRALLELLLLRLCRAGRRAAVLCLTALERALARWRR
jgi:hypothetical protein